MQAVRLTAILLLSLKTGAASAQNSEPVLFLEPGSVSEKVCWHKNARYSLGAVIAVEDIQLQCVRKSRAERNGALKWEIFDSDRAKRKNR